MSGPRDGDAGQALDCDLRLVGRWLPAADARPWLLAIDDGIVRWSGPLASAPVLAVRASVELPEALGLAPGLVDLHVHGARGADAADGSVDALRTIAAAHAAHGTVGLCSTVLASSPAVTLRALEAIRAAAAARGGQPGADSARILGGHLEGPFLNPARAGAQPAEHLRAPDAVLLEELIAAGGPALRQVTLAVELEGAIGLVERLVERGIVVAIGHSAATFVEARRGVDAGCRLVTHLFNAMSPLHHREPGLVGAALCSDELTAEVIADGVHVATPALQLAWRLKRGHGGLALVTDCTAALEHGRTKNGQARLGDQPVEVRGGAARLADGTLAGSVLTMDRALRQMVQEVGVPLAEALAAASDLPREVLGLADAARRADLVVLDRAGLAVRATMVGGRWVYPASAEARERALAGD